MAQFKKKNQQKFWYSPLALLVFFCILIIFAYNMIGLIERNIETSKKKELQMENVALLRKRQADLSRDIEKLNTEEGIEESIRDKYQLAKVGEGVVTIVDEKASIPTPEKSSSSNSFWEFIKRLFKRN